MELDSRKESDCRYEAHRRYIDLHYIIEGTERIATADIRKVNTLVPYSSEKDIGFYEGKADGYMDLTPGCFMVCYPSDAHKVAIQADKSEHIRKIVFKIAVLPQNLLND